MAVTQTHLLDLDFALRQLVVAEDDGEGDTVTLSRLELVLQLRLLLVEEFGLFSHEMSVVQNFVNY